MSNYYQEKLNQIRIALGLETKMAEAMLEDRVTKVEAEAFEPGKKIFVVSESGEKAPAPEGIHTTTDGIKVTVDSEGSITRVDKPEIEVESKEEDKKEMKVEASEEEDKEKMEKEEKEKMKEEEKMEKEKEKEEMRKMVMTCMEAIEDVAKEVKAVKEEMASYKSKMEKMSKEPASGKISTFNANPVGEKVDAIDARLEQFRSLRTDLKSKKKY